MIEIEKKFIINNKIKDRLISGAKFVCKKIFTDLYYDDASFSLTAKDRWLRSRDNRFELKIPVSVNDNGTINQYKELTDETSIKNHLNLLNANSLKKELADNRYSPFCVLTTTRERYKKGKLSIDIDTVTADNFNYIIAEVEIVVGRESDVGKGVSKIMEFMAQNNISEAFIRGKVLEYLWRNDLKHYNVLLSVGVIRGDAQYIN